MGGNNIGAEGANALVEKMKCPKLTEISLHDNGIGAMGTAAMKPALESLSQHGLTEISLNCDDIVTNEGKPVATDFEGINVKLFPESETSKTAVRGVRGKFFVKCDQPPAPGRFFNFILFYLYYSKSFQFWSKSAHPLKWKTVHKFATTLLFDFPVPTYELERGIGEEVVTPVLMLK